MSPPATVTRTPRERTAPRQRAPATTGDLKEALAGIETPAEHPHRDDLTRIPQDYVDLFTPILEKHDFQVERIKQAWLEGVAGEEESRALSELLAEEEEVKAWMKKAQEGVGKDALLAEMRGERTRESPSASVQSVPTEKTAEQAKRDELLAPVRTLLSQAKTARREGDRQREEELKKKITEAVGVLAKAGVTIDLASLAREISQPERQKPAQALSGDGDGNGDDGEPDDESFHLGTAAPPHAGEATSSQPSPPSASHRFRVPPPPDEDAAGRRDTQAASSRASAQPRERESTPAAPAAREEGPVPTNALQIARVIWRINRAVDNKLHRGMP